MTVDELTNEMLATTIKYLSAKRQNFYLSVTGDFDIDREQRDHFNEEIDKLNDAISFYEAERERRRLKAAS